MSDHKPDSAASFMICLAAFVSWLKSPSIVNSRPLPWCSAWTLAISASMASLSARVRVASDGLNFGVAFTAMTCPSGLSKYSLKPSTLCFFFTSSIDGRRDSFFCSEPLSGAGSGSSSSKSSSPRSFLTSFWIASDTWRSTSARSSSDRYRRPFFSKNDTSRRHSTRKMSSLRASMNAAIRAATARLSSRSGLPMSTRSSCVLPSTRRVSLARMTAGVSSGKRSSRSPRTLMPAPYHPSSPETATSTANSVHGRR